MYRTPFWRRTEDGLPRIGLEAPSLPPFERRLALFCILLLASGLFVGGVAPGLLVLGTAFSCAFGEGSLLVDQLVQRRQPLAEVRELPRRRG